LRWLQMSADLTGA